MDRIPYTGPTPKLVIAYDVGTTFSGASYCLLDPGEVPVIRGVKRYPAQQSIGVGTTKIPTILYYDELGMVKAAGAEAIGDRIEQLAQHNGWGKAEWFKLHLRPKMKSSAGVTTQIPPLPEGKTAVQVFADFLKYLHKCSRKYIEETNLDGPNMWKRLEPTIEYVLSHPNGWGGGQQDLMRKAAILAGLIPYTEAGRSRIFFVTDGEASLHFCIEQGLASKGTVDGKGIIVVDAGGGTIDISAYKRTSPVSQTYEEIAPAACVFQGSVFVTAKARKHFDKLLNGSQFQRDIPYITETFDKGPKLVFDTPRLPCFIKFGRVGDNDPKLNITSGQLKLDGAIVAGFFRHSILAITALVENLYRTTEEICSVFLVGGFAANTWLYKNIKKGLTPHGLYVCRPDCETNKAVADGAVSYHIDHRVNIRVAKNFYGINKRVYYNDSDPEHVSRKNSMYMGVDGYKWIPGRFSIILPRGTKVSETQEFRRSYFFSSRNISDLEVNIGIRCYRGLREDPRWLDEESSMYSTLCEVQSDLSHIPKEGGISVWDQSLYYNVYFDVVLSLGLTEIKAWIAWKDNDEEKRSAAQLVYHPDVVINDVPMLDGRV